ncbi:MAG: hypothetical protein L6R39_005517 [Caloplaca ligustica]|nr:MAG: hypothetical protein L6R39_005517 [Caloplaca ligustica]
MAPSAGFGTFVTIESNPQITDLPAAVTKELRHPPPSAQELHDLTPENDFSTLSQPHKPSRSQTPVTPSELEESRPPTPRNEEIVQALQTLSSPPINKWRFGSCCLSNFANGLNDSAPGALIPYMEKSYSIGYATYGIFRKRLLVVE